MASDSLVGFCAVILTNWDHFSGYVSGGPYRVAALRLSHWVHLSDELSLDSGYVIDRARTLAGADPQAVAETASVPPIAEFEGPLPSLLASRVEAHAAECLRRLT